MRAVGLGLAIVLAVATGAAAKDDGRGDRVRVKDGDILRGSTKRPILAVQQPGMCKPDLGDEELIKAFVRVSDVGGTALAIDLHGFNADATALDKKHIDTVLKIKDAANARWMPTVVRVLASLESADDATRMNAIHTVAETFADVWSVVYWIDGPKSEDLAKAFRAEAPKLTVLAPFGGDVQLVTDAKDARKGTAAVVLGALPPKDGGAKNAILPDDPASYEALEEYNRADAEREPWQPSTVGLTAEERADGWISLYDGKSLDGWTIVGDNKKGFESKDGMLSWAAGGGRKLQSRNRYGDFMLRFDWKLYAKGANNGMFLRAPRGNRESKMGFEFQLMGDSDKNPDKNSTGSVYDVVPPKAAAAKPEGEWNTVEVMLQGSKYKAMLNGVLIQDLDFEQNPELKFRLRKGFICISDHGHRASFRDIRIKEL